MAEAHDRLGMIYQNLIDAGCDDQITAQCMALVKNQKYAALLSTLARHRTSLLDTIHTGQKQMDCLDFLIYNIQKNI